MHTGYIKLETTGQWSHRLPERTRCTDCLYEPIEDMEHILCHCDSSGLSCSRPSTIFSVPPTELPTSEAGRARYIGSSANLEDLEGGCPAHAPPQGPLWRLSVRSPRTSRPHVSARGDRLGPPTDHTDLSSFRLPDWSRITVSEERSSTYIVRP
jgi:hypothetical protein